MGWGLGWPASGKMPHPSAHWAYGPPSDRDWSLTALRGSCSDFWPSPSDKTSWREDSENIPKSGRQARVQNQSGFKSAWREVCNNAKLSISFRSPTKSSTLTYHLADRRSMLQYCRLAVVVFEVANQDAVCTGRVTRRKSVHLGSEDSNQTGSHQPHIRYVCLDNMAAVHQRLVERVVQKLERKLRD